MNTMQVVSLQDIPSWDAWDAAWAWNKSFHAPDYQLIIWLSGFEPDDDIRGMAIRRGLKPDGIAQLKDELDKQLAKAYNASRNGE
jgi:hypothetical protein